MPTVEFTANLARQTASAACEVSGDTVREALLAAFERQPQLQGYILDDQGALRTHVVVFLDGQTLRDRKKLSDPVSPTSEIFVMQALSGG